MINFKTKETEIVDYISTNFAEILKELSLPELQYINDFFDLDKYKYNNELFFNFVGYHFEDLSNESNQAQFDMNVFFAIRGDTAANLHERMMNYSSAFYSFFEESGNNFGGLFDYGIITDVKFYDAAEGNKDCKVCSMTMRFYLEV